jgi:hypothetical protein
MNYKNFAAQNNPIHVVKNSLYFITILSERIRELDREVANV